MKNDLPHSASDLSRIYAQRFAANQEYRRKVWRILIDDYFSQFIPTSASVLDLGCGYGYSTLAFALMVRKFETYHL